MQAITTKFHGPTNFRGARVSARCDAGKLTLSWDDGLGVDGNHDKAAHALAEKLGWLKGWHGELIGGGLPEGTGNCYVFTKLRCSCETCKRHDETAKRALTKEAV